MNKQFARILILPLLSISLVLRSQHPLFEKKIQKNQFFAIAGAPAFYTGLSYERLIFKSENLKILPRAGLGLNIFKPSLGKEFSLHLGVTALYGNNHNIEAGFGTVHYLLNQRDIIRETDFVQYKFGLYGLIAYRYYLKKSPFAFKFGIVPVIFANRDRWVSFPLAEIGIGFRL